MTATTNPLTSAPGVDGSNLRARGTAATAAPIAPALQVGQLKLDIPVVLAPMAGITNRAFRRLCREQGAALYISEMVTTRALVERKPDTMVMASFEPDEQPRSVQLYGVDPDTVSAAVRLLVAEDRADHIDLNLGCPVAKVTRKGGGAALPYKRDLLESILKGAVLAANEESAKRKIDPVPVTIKMRMGIDDQHLTYLDAADIAVNAGISWIALHARTAAQFYGGQADWSAIERLVEHVAPSGVPVLGNGDIWTGADAVRMVERTGCDGVVVGRGCLGRPWLFAQLDAAMSGAEIPADPQLRQVLTTMRRHAELLGELYGEDKGCRDFRKHVAWYLKGFEIGSEIRRSLGLVSTLAELYLILDQIAATPDQSYPIAVAAKPRGRTSRARKVALPEFWLDSTTISQSETLVVSGAELDVSGG